jgi:hypothetical protein
MTRTILEFKIMLNLPLAGQGYQRAATPALPDKSGFDFPAVCHKL